MLPIFLIGLFESYDWPLRVLYIFWVQVFFQIHEYFLQSVACLFIPLTVSFIEQKFLILMMSYLSISSFMDGALVVFA